MNTIDSERRRQSTTQCRKPEHREGGDDDLGPAEYRPHAEEEKQRVEGKGDCAEPANGLCQLVTVIHRGN